ncbi:glycoside hydrolase family 15 protein [Micromonospora sp. DT81.3]|uniref:glycoside hydrolase family 15 protein n=1 Tax=Micromonospora sp. DT81.3 TaxID=3416523 RepID=UPI003CE82E81
MTDTTHVPLHADPAALRALATSSVELILQLQDASGAYPASPTFSAYAGYSWFRDGAFIADAMSAVGEAESATKFFDWCSSILLAREGQIERINACAAAGNPVPDGEMLAARFTFAGGDGTDEWWDFQLDGYGTWLWAVAVHAQRHNLDLRRWSHGIRLAVDYLLSSWQRPCFDWWEENAALVHGSTLGCIAAGLAAIADSGILGDEQAVNVRAAVSEIVATLTERGLTDGHLAKWLGSSEVDASLVAIIAPLGVFAASDLIGRRTISAVDTELTVGDGTHRYLADTFFGGGQWPLLSCFLGLAYTAAGDRARALALLTWAASTASSSNALPEQVGEHLLDRSMTQVWIDRWGTVAQPLLWSHAMYIRLAVELEIVEVRA